ncbi:hypothetical protein Taro_025539 [Colocasia esculenta]|uniref:phosphopyruvate hydratase n=1 Tax=Colocasia esculenta TaxID=4460 RepID=A0A843V9M0_COLES|nr:hypothetical protein [Colocasia esculenta]
MSVQEYLDKHLLARKIEDAVNAAVRAKAPDPVLFISNHMKRVVPSAITKIKARQILDSRGIPTVEVDLYTHKGMFRAASPSGASAKIYEAAELRDGDKGKYLGNGVSKAVKNINEKIAEALVPLYKHLADLSGQSGLILPVPAITMISGGKHAGNNLAVQEVMILPIGANTFEEAMQMGSETYHHLKAIIMDRYGSIGCNVGEDGGLAPNISSFREGLDLVKEAIERAGYNGRIKMAMDVAATDFCIGKKYDLDFKSPNKSGQNFKTGEDMTEMYSQLCADYPLVSIEDPFDKDDWEHTKAFTDLGVCQVVGDNLLTSDPKRIERAIHEASCNGLLLKVNQVGTITEVIEVVKQAKDAHWGVIVSHRCGETEDSFIADLAVGLATGQIKAGAPCRGERVVKYNQLLRIEEELGEQAATCETKSYSTSERFESAA